MPRHITIKLLKTKGKEKILKTATAKRYLSLGGKTILMTMNFITKMIEVTNKWHNIFQELKEYSTQNLTTSKNILQEGRKHQKVNASQC